MSEEVKTCTKCNETKGISEFYKNKWGKFGVRVDCKVCVKSYQQGNKAAIAEYKKDYYQKNKEALSDGMKSYQQDNKAAIAEYKKNRYQKNRERLLEYHKNYQRENKALCNSHSAKNRARKRNATPPWLTEDQDLEIKAYYKKAKALEKKDGIQRHVDHIVPLKGKNICGLHVPWNLQVLTAEENLRKGNSYPNHI